MSHHYMISVGYILKAHHFICIHRCILPFDLQWHEGIGSHLFLNALVGFLADQDLVLGGIFLDAFGGIDLVADGSIFHSLFRPNPA